MILKAYGPEGYTYFECDRIEVGKPFLLKAVLMDGMLCWECDRNINIPDVNLCPPISAMEAGVSIEVLHITLYSGDKSLIIQLTENAYLLNDAGKTIDKI